MILQPGDEQFLEDMALLMAPWGWPRPVGRIYAYLLLRAEPATLDEIAADLGMSKSNASVAARTLEHCGNARRRSEPGSKRIYYSVPENHGGPFAAKAALLGRLQQLFCTQKDRVVSADVAGRFDALQSFYAQMQAAIEQVVEAHANKAPAQKTRPAA